MIDSEFQNLLLSFSKADDKDERKDIENRIWQNYGKDQTVVVVDMSGFSLLSQRYGIVHYLSMVSRMQITAEPIIENFGGTVIKFEADNCFATFPEPLTAVRACISLNMAFDAANILTTEDLDIRIACGIDYGKILVINNNDFFGNAVNRASKLGEDTAEPGEILITQDAMQLIPQEAGIKHTETVIDISGIQFNASLISYKHAAE